MSWGLTNNNTPQGADTLIPTLLVLGCAFILEEWLRTILGAITPQITLMAVFVCTLTRGWLPPVGALLALGVVASVLSGLPLGEPSLLLMLMYFFTLRLQTVLERQTFVLLCVAFSVLLAAVTLAENLLLGLVGWPVLSADVLWRWLFGALVCPLYMGASMMMQRRQR